MNWEKVKLKECCLSISDGDHQPPPKSGVGIPFVTISDIKDNVLDFSETMYVPEEYYENLDNKKKPQKGDVLYSVVGSFGIPVLIRKDFKFVFQRHIAILRPNVNLIDPRYLYYTMLNKDFYAMADAAAIGAAQRTLGLNSLRNMEIMLPCIDKQHKIADFLSSYDNLIENNKKQISLLEEAARRLYREWFVDLNFPGHENVKITDGVPEGWSLSKLLELTTIIKRGISPEYDDNGRYIVINQKCIRRSIMDIKESRKQSKEYPTEMNILDGDIVICSTGIGTLGRVGQVFGNYDNTTYDSHVTLIRSEKYKNIIYQSIKHKEKFLMGMGKGSTNQQELYKSVIENLNILMPTDDIAEKSEYIFTIIHNKMARISRQINLLTEARDRLLPKLMSGETEV